MVSVAPSGCICGAFARTYFTMRIPVAGPWITEREVEEYVAEACRSARGWVLKRQGSSRSGSRRHLPTTLECGRAVTLPSCTSAIHLALLALGVGPGDEVIVPDATWIGARRRQLPTPCGASTVFADIDEETVVLDCAILPRRGITAKTRAVILVDLYGGMPEMDALEKIARSRGIHIIEDAAEAIGSEYRGRRAGMFGDVGVFSFHGTKSLTTGEGGMLVTDNDELWSRVCVLRDHGRQPGESKMYWSNEIGYKYKNEKWWNSGSPWSGAAGTN